MKVQNLVQFFQKMAGYTAIVLAFMVLCQSGRSQSPSDYRDAAFGREPGTQVEYILQDRQRGHSLSQLAKSHLVSRATIYRVLKEHDSTTLEKSA